MGGSQDLLNHQSKLASELIVREHRLEDDEVYARLLSSVMSVTYDVSLMRERRQRWSHREWTLWIAEFEGATAGFLEFIKTGDPGAYRLRIVVEPHLRGRGIGSALLAKVIDLPGYSDTKVYVDVRDDDPRSLDFVKKLGFAQRGHSYESFINPQEFELSKFQPYIDRVLQSGFRIATMAELGDTTENRYKLWEIENITDHDIPGVDADELPGWEDAQKSWFTASWFDPEGEYVILDGDKWIAASCCADVSPGISWYVQHTCVIREHRGKGLAIAIKALATQNAKEHGATLLKTNNNSENHPMLAINRKFGFQPIPGWIELAKYPKEAPNT